MAQQQLTPAEVSAVALATRGESYSHRHWPPEVVRAVIAADLIKAGEGRRAEPRRAATRFQSLGARLRAKLGGRRRSTGALAATNS